jgi:hypothetical protein
MPAQVRSGGITLPDHNKCGPIKTIDGAGASHPDKSFQILTFDPLFLGGNY